jgi:hypothetical protein
VIDHDAGTLQRDDAEEQTDAGRHCELEILRDRFDDVFAQARGGDDQRQHAGEKHEGECLLPAVFVSQHEGEGEEGIEPHPRRQRDRVIGV